LLGDLLCGQLQSEFACLSFDGLRTRRQRLCKLVCVDVLAFELQLAERRVLPDPFGPARIVHVGMDYRVIT